MVTLHWFILLMLGLTVAASAFAVGHFLGWLAGRYPKGKGRG